MTKEGTKIDREMRIEEGKYYSGDNEKEVEKP
jgi:hypothetical protein